MTSTKVFVGLLATAMASPVLKTMVFAPMEDGIVIAPPCKRHPHPPLDPLPFHGQLYVRTHVHDHSLYSHPRVDACTQAHARTHMHTVLCAVASAYTDSTQREGRERGSISLILNADTLPLPPRLVRCSGWPTSNQQGLARAVGVYLGRGRSCV
jgi:hypothetical protein